MNEKNEIKTLVVCVMPNHPSGTRNRAGFTFTTTPVVFEVTAEQEKAIREDKFLRIIERGTALDDAMSAYKKKLTDSSIPEENSSNEWSEAPKNEEWSEEKAKPIARMNKEELIAGLEAKWLKAGEGFNPEANNKDLAALLASL